MARCCGCQADIPGRGYCLGSGGIPAYFGPIIGRDPAIQRSMAGAAMAGQLFRAGLPWCISMIFIELGHLSKIIRLNMNSWVSSRSFTPANVIHSSAINFYTFARLAQGYYQWRCDPIVLKLTWRFKKKPLVVMAYKILLVRS